MIKIDKKAWNWTVIIIIISVILYLIFVIFSDIRDVIGIFKKFNWIYIPIILFLSFISYVFRAIRWHYYLKELGVNLTIKETFILYFASLSVLIVPLVLAGFIKASFIKKKTGIEISRTLPIVMVERITDLIGMLIIASICLFFFQFGIIKLIWITILLFVFILIIQNKNLCLRILNYFEKTHKPRVKKFILYVKNSYESSYILLRPKPLFVASILGIFSWSFAGICMYLILQGLDIDLSILTSIFIFIFPSIIGVVTQLPGGIGAEEGGIFGLLTKSQNIDASSATAAMLLIKFVTLWFGIIIGVIGLKIFSKEFLED